MPPRCEPLCHFCDRYLLPSFSTCTRLEHCSLGYISLLSLIRHPLRKLSIVLPQNQDTSHASAGNPKQAHLHRPTTMLVTITSQLTINFPIYLFSKTGAH